MGPLTKPIESNALAAFSAKAPVQVIHAIEKASARTGVNFAYMVQQAAAESSFDPQAKAKTSSATGLYQFIESTWMSMIERYGAKHNIDTEGMSRKEILALRKDAEISSLMAGEFAAENERFLQRHYKGEIGSTELYFAHFMGAGGAAAFLNARDENPLQQAAVLFPKAAKANRNVFYDTKTGRPKTMDEVYAFFDKKFAIDTPPPTPGIKPGTGELVAAVQEKTAPETQAALTAASAERPAIRSSVFRSAGLKADESLIVQQLKAQPRDPYAAAYKALPYQSLIQSPIDLIMLTQVGLPIESGKDSKFF